MPEPNAPSRTQFEAGKSPALGQEAVAVWSCKLGFCEGTSSLDPAPAMECAASDVEQQVMVVSWKLRFCEGQSSLDLAPAMDFAESAVEQQVMVVVTHPPESHHQPSQAPGSRRQLALSPGSPSHLGRWPFLCAVPGASFWKRSSESSGSHPMCTPTGQSGECFTELLTYSLLSLKD